ELASIGGFNSSHQAFLEQLTESIGIVLNTIEANMRTEGLLQQSQSLANQLQTRQQELQATNEQLQEKAQLLALQNREVERKKTEVEQARQALEEKAKQLSLTSKYKSEFLANMSHELRTPLNSLLILSDQLSKNPDGNLTSRQQEFAKTIHSSGNDLLMLINDILDLSKIESGTVVVDARDLPLEDLRGYVERTFGHVAESKNLVFQTRFDPRLPKSILTDSKRLQQIIKNLLSNAFKFTHRGQVTLSVEPVTNGWNPENEDLNRAEEVICFAVSDTGIGIPVDKQQIIFEAFQQADGSTSRKYGGTGLGLAISRELSRLLGGEIKLSSLPNHGSTFHLYLPTAYTPPVRPIRKGGHGGEPTPASLPVPAARPEHNGHAPAAGAVVGSEEIDQRDNLFGDDRDLVMPGDRVLLIIENDPVFARFLLDAARQQGFKGLVTSLGAASITLIRTYQPNVITLDIHLPDIDGWQVLERIKKNPDTRHVPVVVISTEDARDRAFSAGCVAFLGKPIQGQHVIDGLLEHIIEYITRPTRHLLLVEPDAHKREDTLAHLTDPEVRMSAVGDARAAIRVLHDESADCIIVGPGGAGLHELFLSSLGGGDSSRPDREHDNRLDTRIPVILFGHEPASSGADVSHRTSQACVVRHAHTPEVLLDLATFFLHRPIARLPEVQQRLLSEMHRTSRILAGHKVLIVDDDMRNIFALTTILEEHDMVIVSADNGRDAIRMLQDDPHIEIVLLDIMMPEMDGLTTMQKIRQIPKLKTLPIVAVTAKAMKGDREKCIEAGAWDYLSKPVDPEQLLAVLRAWLHR
ncbi:MAG TPA: response regulator, partial [Gemmata sp.]|nr:response regulator [Gemmata sp.]